MIGWLEETLNTSPNTARLIGSVLVIVMLALVR